MKYTKTEKYDGIYNFVLLERVCETRDNIESRSVAVQRIENRIEQLFVIQISNESLHLPPAIKLEKGNPRAL